MWFAPFGDLGHKIKNMFFSYLLKFDFTIFEAKSGCNEFIRPDGIFFWNLPGDNSAIFSQLPTLS